MRVFKITYLLFRIFCAVYTQAKAVRLQGHIFWEIGY